MFVLNSDFIKEKIESKNYNQTSFSDVLGITPANFSYMLGNKSKLINLEVAYKICQLLDLKIEDIIIDTAKTNSSKDLLFEMYYLVDKLNNTTKQHMQKVKRDNHNPDQLTFNLGLFSEPKDNE